MRKWTTMAGLFFMGIASVYTDGAAGGEGEVAGPQETGAIAAVESADPFATPAAATQPANEGQSVSATQVNVSDVGTVEIHVNDASLVEVLRMMSLQSQKNIIASKDVRGTVTANLFDVTVREALDAILHANGYAYREKGNFIYVYTAKEMAEIEKAERKVSTQTFRLFYTPAANAVNMIKPVLSTDGQVSYTKEASSGIETGIDNLGGNSHAVEDILVVTDYPDVLERVKGILAEVDRRPQQILIEATILRATLSEDNALGVDFTILGGVDFSSISHSNGQLNGASLTDGLAADSKTLSAGTGNNFTRGIQNAFKVGYVSNNVAIFLAALEGVTDTTVLANPKILALNKQKGEVIVGRKDGYLTTTVTESATVQTVEFLETGTRLIFRPYVGDDGYIRMEIHPEDSSGGLTSANLPFKVTTEVTSNVMIKDGHTIVIGGLFRESSDISKSQVPFLGNLPLAGHLFRNQRDRTTREEIIILLTPHIVKDVAAYSEASEEMRRDAEKMRVGVRKGMMPWGRERLAEWSYQRALDELSKANPNRKKALWHLDCALNLNPHFLEAMDLRQELGGKELSAVDNSSIRTFVRRQILAERAQPATTMPTGMQAEGQAEATPALAQADATTLPVADADQAVAEEAIVEESALADAETAAGEQATADDQVEVAQDDAGSDESVAESEMADTEVAQAEDTESDVVTTEATEIEVAEIEEVQTEVVEAEVTETETLKAEAVEVVEAQPASPATTMPASASGMTVTELPLDEAAGEPGN